MQRRVLSSCAAAFAVCAPALTAAAEEFVVLDNSGTLLTLVDTDAGSVVGSRTLSGIGDDRILALERSAHDGIVYALGRQRLYRVDVPSATLMPVGPPFPYDAFGSTGVGFDALGDKAIARVLRFNSQPGANQPIDATDSYDVDLATGHLFGKQMVALADGRMQPASYEYVAGDPSEALIPALRDLASTAGSAGALSWSRFAVDVERRTLVRLGQAGGLATADDDEFAVTTIGSFDGLRADATPDALEIAADGSAYVLVTSPFHVEEDLPDLPEGPVVIIHGPLPTPSGIYRVDLTTGASERILPLTIGSFRDFALASDVRVAAPLRFSVTKAAMRFDFRSARRDTMKLEGTMTFDGTGLTGLKISVVVGNDVREFTLDGRGRGRSGRHQIRVNARRSPTRPSFVLTLRGDSSLHDIVEPRVGTASDGEFQVSLESHLRGVAAVASIDLNYRRRGSSGSATLVP